MLPTRIGAIGRWILSGFSDEERREAIIRLERKETVKRVSGGVTSSLEDTQGHTLFGFLRAPSFYLSESWMSIRVTESLGIELKHRVKTADVRLPELVAAPGIPPLTVLSVSMGEQGWCECELNDLRYDWRPRTATPYGPAISPRSK